MFGGADDDPERDAAGHVHGKRAERKNRRRQTIDERREEIARHRSERAANRNREKIHVEYERSPVIMPLLEIVTSSGLGSLLGLRHALEPDHLAAISTLVDRERGGRSAALVGAWWGLGHTLALLIAGAVLVVARAEMPAAAGEGFEFLVALMLVALGIRAIRQAALQGPGGPLHVHRHGRLVHTHAGAPAHVHIGTWMLARRPLLIGALHGLAGSGALTALVLATLPTTAARLSYVLLFGIGSTLGMAALSGLLGWPLARFGTHHAVARSVTLAAGFTSLALGIVWALPIVGRLL
jgi:high-affinity nickel-transport protein